MSFQNDLEDAKRRARGAVFHHYSARAAKNKLIVVLNRTWPPNDGNVAYAFTTTKLDYFARARIPQEWIVRLDVGEYDFITAPTVIDIPSPQIEQLDAIVSAASFKFVVQLRSEHVHAIDDAVRACTTITRRVKKMILADYG